MSRFQVYVISSVYCIVCSSPKFGLPLPYIWPPHPSDNHQLFRVYELFFIRYFLSYIPHMREIVISALFYLTYLVELGTHPCPLLQMAVFHPLLWPSSVPLCEHRIFVQSPTKGHLGCFRVLATMNNAAVNIQAPICLWIFSNLGGRHPKEGLLGQMVTWFLIFWGASILFSIMVILIYTHTSSVWGFLFLYILSNHCYLLSFDYL